MAVIPQATAQRILQALRRDFDAAYYLAQNQDVRAASIGAFEHFIRSGLLEGRAGSAQAHPGGDLNFVREALGREPRAEDFDELARSAASFSLRAVVTRAAARVGLVAASPDQFDPLEAATVERKGRRRLVDLVSAPCVSAMNPQGWSFATAEAAARYLLDEGWKELTPANFHLRPDFEFYRGAHGPFDRDDKELYLLWLEGDHAHPYFISEGDLLGAHGCTPAPLGDRFDHTLYLASQRDLPLNWSRARALLHFVTSGLEEGRLSWAFDPSLGRLIEERAQALEARKPETAMELYGVLAARACLSDRGAARLARLHCEAKRPGAALAALQARAPVHPADIVHVHLAAADALRGCCDLDGAVAAAGRAVSAEPKGMWLESHYFGLLHERFEITRHGAERLAQLGQPGKAREMLSTAARLLERDQRRYGENVAEPVHRRPPPSTRPIRVGILADLFLPQCRLYRVEQKCEQLEHAGLQVDVFDFREQAEDALEAVGLYDLWIYYRTPAFFEVLQHMAAVALTGAARVYEIDDLLFDANEFPEPIESYGGLISERDYAGLALTPVYVAEAARRCDAAIASTPALARALGALTGSGECLVHRNALSAPHQAAIARHAAAPRKAEDDRVVIFYGSGTKAHKDYLQEVLFSALADALRSCPEAQLHLVGETAAAELSAEFGDRVRMCPPEWNVQAYWDMLAQADINLAALKPSRLTDCKSEIKWLEAAMLGIPSIVSPTETMRGVIEEGVTGLFAASERDWSAALQALIRDPARRRAMGEAARSAALSAYSLESLAGPLASFVRGLAQGGAAALPALKD